MPEKAVLKQLNKAKRGACKILSGAGYAVELANNNSFCLTAARDTEWRVVAIGTQKVVKCSWFLEQVRRLEKYPAPNVSIIKKEVWIKGDDEQNYHKYYWKNNQWVNENAEAVTVLN